MTEQEFAAAYKGPTREGVLRAMTKIADILPQTPLLPLEVDGVTIWCKAEMLQPIGAFKIRGAWHRLSDLNEEDRGRGVVGVSSGNHAQGVAWAAKKLGIAATIVMPSNAPRMKLEATKALGADVVLYDRATESREEVAAGLIGKSGATLVHAFGDPWVIEGQGTAGIEITEQLRGFGLSGPDMIVSCCGGGGLASGLALACPDAEIAIVEPEGWDDIIRSLDAGEILPVNDLTLRFCAAACLRVFGSRLVKWRARCAWCLKSCTSLWNQVARLRWLLCLPVKFNPKRLPP
jgi:threonine dehydratase